MNLMKRFPLSPCPVFSGDSSSCPQTGTSVPVVPCTSVVYAMNRRARDGWAAFSFSVAVCDTGRWFWLNACRGWRVL